MKKLTVLFLLLLVLSQACSTSSPGGVPGAGAAQPEGNSTSGAQPTQVKNSASDTQGVAVFQDDSSGRQLGVKITDSQGQPLQDMSVSFIKQDSSLLVFVKDPKNQYFPTAREVELGKKTALAGGHLAAVKPPVKQAEILIAISLLRVLDAALTAQDWIDSMREAPPHMDRWGFLSQDYCATGDQMAAGLSRSFGTALFILSSIPGLSAGVVAADAFADWSWITVLKELTETVVGQQAQAVLKERVASGGAILKWRVYSINGIPFGAPAIPIGWCLEPLNRNSTDSVGRWIQYGLSEKEPYVFEQLVTPGDISAGVPYTEAGGHIGSRQLLENFRRSLPNGIGCELISVDANASAVTFVTSGWNPPFVVPEIVNLMTGEVSMRNAESKFVVFGVVNGYFASAGIWPHESVDDLVGLLKSSDPNATPCG